ncbi:transcription elongation factor 1 homolog [Synchiropus picturatus]
MSAASDFKSSLQSSHWSSSAVNLNAIQSDGLSLDETPLRRSAAPPRSAHPQHPAAQMGRRKSKRKPPPKKKMTGNLDTQFTCPFCNHEKSCDVKMERTRNTGIISCSVCLEEFQTPITYLSEPVDVYSDWIDACEAANQ